MLSLFRGLIDANQREIKRLRALVDQITALEPQMQRLKDEEFAAQMASFKQRVSEGENLDDLLVEVFALVREASVRSVKMRPFDVQLMAAVAFHEGKIAEQKTGEGKTLSAAPALILNSLTGRGVHLVTVNDFLVRLGAGWMGPLYHLLGLSVGVIYSGEGDLPAALYDPEFTDKAHADERLQHLRPISRTEAYAADITYGTNNEFGFDYLRDNMAQSQTQMVQREHVFAIVDEVDSILIDEARTPLIISMPDMEATDKYYRFAQLLDHLSDKIDYEVDEKLRTANLTDHGLRKLEKTLGIENIYEKDFDTVHHMEQALKAKTLFQKDRDYVVKDGQIVIVDEHTGRLMFGRRYSEGLHQAIEAKEGVQIQQESRTLATISLQNYFRMYEKLAGMTGTAVTEAEEFKKIYNLEVVVVPTNKIVIRQDLPDLVYKTTRAKYAAIVREIEEKNRLGQPILVGTKSIEQNDVLSAFLKKKRIPHQVLNAKNHEKEAEIIAQAGQVGAITVATNIAGRGVDIILGGAKEDKKETEWQKEHERVKDLGGLHIIGAVRHESRRIDDQLRGRAGRQGDPGSSRFYVSLEDDIMRIFGGEQVSRLMEFLKVPEDQPLEAGMVSRAIQTAQSKVESFYFDQRKQVVEYDDVVNKQREIIYTRRKEVLVQANAPQELRKHLQEILHKQIDILISLVAPEGIGDNEADLIVQHFAEFVPLSDAEAKALRRFVVDNSDPEVVKNKLIEMMDQTYQARLKQFGEQNMMQLERAVMLQTIDRLWMDHLDALDDLRDGISLRQVAQKDPLVEYKHEAFGMFEALLGQIDHLVSQQLLRLMPAYISQEALLDKAVAEKKDIFASNGKKETPSGIKKVVSGKKKLSRNDPCWCGSGKKWKKCHYPQIG